MIKDNCTKRKTNPYSRAYMNSYEWNYMVLELVDYIEENLSQEEKGDDSWKNFKMFCSLRSLNWRVIRKMIEYTIALALNSEADLIGHEAFRPLESGNDAANETPSSVVESKQEPLVINLTF